MKKLILVLSTFIIVTLSTITAHAEPIEINTTDREEVIVEDEAYQIWKESHKPKYGDISSNNYSDLITVMYFGNEEDGVYVTQYLYKYMDLMPSKVVSYLRENGYKIYVQDVVEFAPNVTVSGYTNFDTNEIFVSLSTENDIGMILCHEIGHVVYRKMTRIQYKELYNMNETVNQIYFHENMNWPYICFRYEESLAQMYYEYLMYPFELRDGKAGELFYMYNSVLELY